MLFIIPTPIGNLKDITYRAVETLGSVDFILCEDTRRTKKLLNHFDIKTPVIRYNEHSIYSLNKALELLKNGNKLGLVSDGGTPCISDPGHKLISMATAEKIGVISLAGASSVTTALAGSGFGGGSFVFLGFLPRKKSKIINLVTTAGELKKPVIIFESPHRIVKLLKLLRENFNPQTQVSLARELTKLHEEWIYGSLEQVYEKLSVRNKILGEIVLILNPLISSFDKESENTN